MGAIAMAIVVVALAAVPLAPAWRLGSVRHPDAGPLSDVGWKWSLVRWELLRSAVGAAVAALLVAAGGPAVLGAAALLGPSIAVRIRAQICWERSRIPATRLLVAAQAALRSGVPLVEALRIGLEGCDDPIARRPIETALARSDLGEPIDRALSAAAAALPPGRVSSALEALALGVSERLPIERVAALLAAVVDRSLFEERLAGEVAARAAGVRTQLWLLAALVPALAAYLALSMPSLAATLGGPLGRSVLVPTALLLEIAGIVLSRRIVRRAAC